MLRSKSLSFEINDFYQKQTLRNRTSIYSPNGRLNLVIPVKFSSKKKERLKDIKICNDIKWQKNHLKSIQTAYRSSPYFEFFEDYFSEIFEKKEKFLVDVSIKSIEIIFKILELEFKFTLSQKNTTINMVQKMILGILAIKKEKAVKNLTNQYTQVFEIQVWLYT